MIPTRREKFNAQFSEASYRQFLRSLEHAVGGQIEFRVCETPVFLPAALLEQMLEAAGAIITQLSTPEYLAASERAIPAAFRAPNETAHPNFIQIDFAITRDAQGNFGPKLVELQGCASVHAFQLLLSQEFQRHFDLSGLRFLLSRLNERDYVELLRQAVLGTHQPEQTILMEIAPRQQKTWPDFSINEKLLGVPTVDITDIFKRGRKLLYRRDGQEVEIRRIYNRVIVDELVQKQIAINFDYRDELDVEWSGHPNWFFRLSKFSLPFLHHPTVPRSWFLNQFEVPPERLSDFVLKPLFSFAGSGVKVDLTQADLDAIPAAERGDYLLQEKIAYEPVIATPKEPSKVEVRLMFIWPDNEPHPMPATLLARLSKGSMMGVDFNKNRSWVGSSACFFEA